jgi:hypothetical protein
VLLQRRSGQESHLFSVHAARVLSVCHKELSLSENVVPMHSPHNAVAVGGLAQLLAAEDALEGGGSVH